MVRPSLTRTISRAKAFGRVFVIPLVCFLSLGVPARNLENQPVYSSAFEQTLKNGRRPPRFQAGAGTQKKTSNKRVTVTDIGPELGISYAIEGFVINPLNRQEILVPSQNGLFKSTDGGTNWHRVKFDPELNLLEIVASVRLDPRDPHRVYAITNNPAVFGWGLFKSDNFGETWEILLGLDSLADYAPHQTLPNVLFALQRTAETEFGDEPGSALLKANDGVSFEYQAGNGLPEIIFDPNTHRQLSNPIFTSMAMSPDPNVMYVVNVLDTLHYYPGGVYKSTDGGQSFTRLVDSPLEPLQVFPHPAQANTIFLQVNSNSATSIFRSNDGGANFDEITNGLPAGKLNFFVEFDPTNPSNVYVAGEGGLFRSTDGGLSFAPTGLRSTQIGAGASTLSVDPKDSKTIYVNTSAGNYKSLNGGASFFPINHGWTAASVSHITFDNNAQPNLYLSTQDGNGLLTTRTRGKFYDRLGSPIEQGVLSTSWVSALAVAPSNPNFIVALTRAQGVFRSLDGGRSWSSSDIDTGQTRFTSFSSEVAIDPINPANVYIACGNAPNPGFYKSEDGGETFTRSFYFPGSVLASVFTDLALDPSNPANIYTGSAILLTEGSLLKSVDAGLGFTPTVLAEEASVSDIVIDPQNPNNIYVAGAFFSEFGEFFVIRSTDGGATFVQGDSGLENNFIALAIDPINPARLFAWTESGLFISENYAADWVLLEGDETQRRSRDFGLSMAVNPKNPNLIYLAGASVLEVEIK